MATIENFATVRYTSNGTALTRVSNVAEIGLASSLSFTKVSLGNEYEGDGTITYILTITNTSSTPLTSLTITDDLGTFTEGALTLTPVTYVGPAILLVDGLDVSAQLTVDSSNPASCQNPANFTAYHRNSYTHIQQFICVKRLLFQYSMYLLTQSKLHIHCFSVINDRFHMHKITLFQRASSGKQSLFPKSHKYCIFY